MGKDSLQTRAGAETGSVEGVLHPELTAFAEAYRDWQERWKGPADIRLAKT